MLEKDTKKIPRRIDENDNPFIAIIREMTTKNRFEDIEDENINISNYSSRRKRNLKNQVPAPPQLISKIKSQLSDNLTPSPLPKGVKRSLLPLIERPYEKKLKIASLDPKKQSRKILNFYIYINFFKFSLHVVTL